ncbi:MAG: polyhydroxyalkanoate synthesis regulator phasin [Myxococcota bacterium]|jgi:polyhydroxyalkanoate synthesis regulator phasin
MSNKDLKDQRRRKLERTLDGLRDDIADLSGEATFSELVKAVSDATATLPAHTEDLKRLRSRGYAFRGDLEVTLEEAHKTCEPVMAALRREIDQVDNRLQREVSSLSRDAARITGNVLQNSDSIESLESKVRGVKSEVSATSDRLKAHSDPLLKSINELKGKVKDLHWTLDQFDSATFNMAPEERPIAAAQAIWEDAPDADKPAGMLMFTDHRVRFEQKEERVTKRKFFVFAAEKESLQALMLDEPVGHLLDSVDSTRGWVMKDQLLTFSWSPKAKTPSTTTFEITSGSAADWDGVVELIRVGDLASYESEAAATSRAPDLAGGAPAAGAAHKVSWPDKCTTCDAPLEAPVKGQTALPCPYCGTNHAVQYLS